MLHTYSRKEECSQPGRRTQRARLSGGAAYGKDGRLIPRAASVSLTGVLTKKGLMKQAEGEILVLGGWGKRP